MASLLDYVPYLALNFILNMDSEYGFQTGFHLILNVGYQYDYECGHEYDKEYGP